jgi:hypothetical protein
METDAMPSGRYNPNRSAKRISVDKMNLQQFSGNYNIISNQ